MNASQLHYLDACSSWHIFLFEDIWSSALYNALMIQKTEKLEGKKKGGGEGREEEKETNRSKRNKLPCPVRTAQITAVALFS